MEMLIIYIYYQQDIFYMRTLLLLLIVTLFIMASHGKSQYRVIRKTETLTNVTLQLQYFGKDEYYGKPSSPIVKNLQFIFQCLASGQFNFKITDSTAKRFEILSGQPFARDSYQNFSFPLSFCGVEFKYSQNPFDFSITKSKSQTIIFSTYQSNFIYSNYYIELGTQVANNKIFGLGQRFSVNFRKYNALWTVFNRAGDQQIDYGTGNNTYGYYPFYLLIDKNHEAYINYIKSTNAMDVFKTENKGKDYLTFKIIGGIINFRFSIGDSNVIQLIQNFQKNCIGKPAIPPFWSLGFHQSKWGYDSVDYLNEVLSNYKSYGIPLDTIWSDIDYMDEFKDFTVDEENFPLDQMKKITDEFHYVPIVDAGVSFESDAFSIGHQRDVFIKDLYGREVRGVVWPGDTGFVDYFHPNATKYWMDMLEDLYSKVKFSGIWLDMNEIQQFCDGPCQISTLPSIIDYSKDIPYHPGSHLIQFGTISLNATHYNNISQFNVHPYFALMEMFVTNKFLKTKSKFPFILSRSTTFGSNQYGFHWTGDNFASWQFLRSSVVDNMNMNLAGIQMVGPDICGFGGNTTEELCARWYQLSAVYPFARSHSDYASNPQEPYNVGPNVLQSAFKNLKLRYTFLKQYYSFWIRSQGFVPFFSSLSYYPSTLQQLTDMTLYDEIVSTQFFILDKPLLVAPILKEETSSRQVWFVNYTKINQELSKSSAWIDIYTGVRYLPGLRTISGIDETYFVPLFMVQGSAMFIQNVSEVTKTAHLGNQYILLSAFDYRNTAQDINTYVSEGSILSVSNYQNETNIENSLKNVAEYQVKQKLYINKSSGEKSIDFTATFTSSDLREPILVKTLIFFVNNELFTYYLPQEIVIYEKVAINIPILDMYMKINHQIWESILGTLSVDQTLNLQTE